MLKTITAIVAGAMLTLGAASAAPMGIVYTANERDASISQVTLDNGQTRTIKLDMAPHNVQVSPDGKLLLAVGMPAMGGHQQHAGGGQLQVFSTGTFDKPLFTLPVGNHPAHVVTDLSGKHAFVSDSEANEVMVFDLDARKQTAAIKTGKYPHGLRPSPDGKTLYVANMKDNSISVIDIEQAKETFRIPVGKAPVQVGFAPDGRQAYVSLSAENTVGLIDTAKQTLVTKVPVGRTPIQMYATPDGKQVYVANQGTSKLPDDKVSVIDPSTGKILATIKVGKGAHGVAISSDGAYVFVSNIESGTFSVIDTASKQVVATHKVGAGPNGISYQPQ